MKNCFSTNKNKNVKIKICGLFQEGDFVAVNKVLPDYIGFVFAKSRRMVDFQLAYKISSNLNPNIKKVGVFVNEKIENILKLHEAKIIDIAQLHGDEGENFIENLKSSSNMKIIKAVKPGVATVLPQNADYILFDTPDKNLAGGTGKTFDWSLIPSIDKPIFLAGGLNAGNICQALERVSPFAVDISSGVETNGHKDFQKILEIVNLVRGNKNE